MDILQKLFGFNKAEHNVRTEILAGITTFLTMSYILAVNPAIFSLLEGMPGGAVFTSTALAAIIGCLAMAVWGKLPFGLAPGIGLYIAFIGVQNAGIIVNNDATLVGLGDITSGSALLGLIGLLITGFLYVKQVKGAMLMGILITTVIGIPMGITEYKGIVSQPESIAPIFCQFQWENIFTLDMIVVIFTFLFIDMFDTVGTLVGVCTRANMVDKNGKIERLNQAFMADAIATAAGAVLGTSATTTYVESAAGVAQGGRTGLTAFTIGCCFAVTLFFSPLFLSIPSAATAPVLVIVGLLMLEPIRNINFNDYTESIPAFICVLLMPLAYSISDGILIGIISYVVLNIVCGNFKKLTPAMYILAILFILKYIFI